MSLNWKHYLAILAPYAVVAAGAVAEYAAGHSQNALVVLIGGAIASALNHGNVISHAQAATP